jgi:NhaC family Na+:H+ antiporter
VVPDRNWLNHQNILIALIGTLAGIFAIVFQPHIINQIAGVEHMTFQSAYKVMDAITKRYLLTIKHWLIFFSRGMQKMLGTIWLIICAMVLVVDAIGALSRISLYIKISTYTFGLFASTVGSCLALNITASDQYLAVPVKCKSI